MLYSPPVPDDSTLDRSGPVPLWEQIAGHIASQITNGRLRPGARLPAEPDLEEQYGVALGTIRRAMEGLRERGLVETRHGKGSFVRSVEPENSREPDA